MGLPTSNVLAREINTRTRLAEWSVSITVQFPICHRASSTCISPLLWFCFTSLSDWFEKQTKQNKTTTTTKKNRATFCSILEQFSIECRKTKTKVITLPNHKGRRIIHWPIKTRSNYTKKGNLCEQVTIGFGFATGFGFGWKSSASFLSQSRNVVMQNQSKPKLLSTLKWKPL